MEQWHCFKCKEKMVESIVLMAYLGRTGTVGAIKCPECGAAYLLEETVVRRVARAEEMLENK